VPDFCTRKRPSGFLLLQIDGMRMDLTKARYANFDELYDYCYKVAGAVGLMTTPVMGVDPSYKVSSIPLYCYMYHNHITAYIYIHTILLIISSICDNIIVTRFQQGDQVVHLEHLKIYRCIICNTYV
jgi:hypothetical protein